MNKYNIKIGDRLVWTNGNCHGVVTELFYDEVTGKENVMIDCVFYQDGKTYIHPLPFDVSELIEQMGYYEPAVVIDNSVSVYFDEDLFEL